MSLSVRISQQGGVEVLRLENVALGAPGPREVRLRQAAVGLNYRDIYERSGLYPLKLPSGLGLEAAGVVEEVGREVRELAAGDRVAYGIAPHGAYATERLIDARWLVRLPSEIDFETAAAMMLKGMTVEYLVRRTVRVEPGQWVLLHAAAGGVGLLACQWLKAIGARVIGTVGSDEKAELARMHGCEHTVVRPRESVVGRVRELTGEGVHVVYDSIGRETFDESLDCLRRRGTLVSFGSSSGPPPPVDLGTLSRKGSLYVTRPGLDAYTATREELVQSAASLFEMVLKGDVKVRIHQRWPLTEVGAAHRALEERRTTGSSILLP